MVTQWRRYPPSAREGVYKAEWRGKKMELARAGKAGPWQLKVDGKTATEDGAVLRWRTAEAAMDDVDRRQRAAAVPRQGREEAPDAASA